MLADLLARLPLIGAPIRRRAWYPWRHQWVLHFGARENVTFTQFMRLPHQYEALAGLVVDLLSDGRAPDRPLRFIVVGCSNGAEPYSIASVLLHRRPGLAFDILASDLEAAMIEKAKTARYTSRDVNMMAELDASFVGRTFEPDGDDFVVRPEIRARVSFAVADVLDPEHIAALGKGDVVVAQNFLYHLHRRDARRAFANIVSLLAPRSALFVDGMDIDLRPRLTHAHGLEPLDHLIPEIHADALKLRGAPWPWTYWSLEPIDTGRRDWKRRYATIYLRGVSAPRGTT